LTYNARYELSLLPPATGWSLHAVTTHRNVYLDLGW